VKRGVLSAAFLRALAAAAPAAGGPGSRRGGTITAETVEYYLGVAEGDDYDPVAITGSFQRFWDSGLVENLLVEVEEIAPDKVRLIVTVTERPKVSEFAFEGNKKLSTNTIKEKLDTAGIPLKRNVPLRESDVQRIKRAIKDAYEAEGFASAEIVPEVEEVGANLRKVTFWVDEGVKVKIGDIDFEGNRGTDGHCAGRARNQGEECSGMFSKKTVWNKRTGARLENVKKYTNRGYDVVVTAEGRGGAQPRGRNPEEEEVPRRRRHPGTGRRAIQARLPASVGQHRLSR
jgi:outer membrane protein insertion porin family